MRKLSNGDLEELRRAREILENPGLVARMTNVLGTPLEKGFELLPANYAETIQVATHKAIQKALNIAVGTMDHKKKGPPNDFWHKMAVGVTGGAGGAFGLAALAVELPISTAIMLRSIADIGRSQGEDLENIDAQLACLEVFALGGESPADDASDSGYFLARAALAKAVTEAAKHIAKKGAIDEAAPALVRLIAMIASRLEIVVTEKAAATAVPVLGAAGGVLINTLFMDHFQDMAHGHFTVRRLERKYGPAIVRSAYDEISSKPAAQLSDDHIKGGS